MSMSEQGAISQQSDAEEEPIPAKPFYYFISSFMSRKL